MNDYVYQIKQAVTMRDVAEFYGFSVNRQNKTICPFHNDKNASLHVYPGDRGFHCFSCHAGGDVIDFVAGYFGLSFKDACKKINDDFSLGLQLDGSQDAEERRRADENARRIQQRQMAEKRRKAALIREYDDALAEWIRLDRIIRDRAPVMISEMDLGLTDDEWTDAMSKIAGAEERLRLAEIAVNESEVR